MDSVLSTCSDLSAMFRDLLEHSECVARLFVSVLQNAKILLEYSECMLEYSTSVSEHSECLYESFKQLFWLKILKCCKKVGKFWYVLQHFFRWQQKWKSVIEVLMKKNECWFYRFFWQKFSCLWKNSTLDNFIFASFSTWKFCPFFPKNLKKYWFSEIKESAKTNK